MIIKYFSNYYSLDQVYKFYISDSNTITLYYQNKLENWHNETIYFAWDENPHLFLAIKEYMLSKYTGNSKE